MGAHRGDHIEVGETRLHHQDIGALGLVLQGFGERLARVAEVHLIGRTRALEAAVHGIAERSVESRGELGRVGHDRDVREALGIEACAHGADHAVHHSRRREHVGTGTRGRDRLALQVCQRRVIQHLVTVHHAAVTVVGVLTKTVVADHDHVGGRGARAAHHACQQAVRVPGVATDRVFVA